MNFLNNVNISKKLTIGFAIVVTVVAVMCAAVFASLLSIKSAVAHNDQSADGAGRAPERHPRPGGQR